MNPPPQPLSKRKLVQLMVILTILAWATQTLFHQWGYGATLPPSPAPALPLTTPTLEIRDAVTLPGATTIFLSDITRFSQSDAPRLARVRIADIPIASFAVPELSKRITTADIRTALARARINPASLRLSGSTSCLVTRTFARSSLAASATDVQPAPPEAPSTTQPAFTVHPGDFLTVTFDLQPTRFQTVLRAQQQGSLHSTIKAQNESTGVTHLVTLTSPTEATWTPRED